ncbi:hypothetical protein Fmac_020681 [Flemingia macrophylla]|uniref:Uncharacterized protein n=1 Tax=Flemingia macrophylla TaxID=520843 RepID=A0ABD1LUR4_9FABA
MASSRHRGHSKAQTCFFKILRIISSTPPTHSPTTKPTDIDLNHTLSTDQQHQQLRDKPSRNQPQPN